MAISTEQPRAANPAVSPGLSRPGRVALGLLAVIVLAGTVGYFVINGRHGAGAPATAGNPSANSPAPAGNGHPAVAPTTPAPTTVDPAVAIAVAWRNAEAAWVANSIAPGGSASLIDASYTDPQLSVLKRQLAAEKRDGLTSRGGIDQVAGTIHAVLTSPTQATLTACEVNHLQLLLANGQPFPGRPGDPTPTPDVAHVTMVLTDGGWKVSTIKTVNGPCLG